MRKTVTFLHKLSLIFCLIVTFSLQSFAQYSVGDYGSTSNGNWTTVATWSTWNGASWVASASIPNQANNVFILSGKTVTLTSSPNYCRNLTVEAGGKLWTNSSTNNYLYVFGPNLVCDGQIGNGATFDGISFGIEGATCTITGAGSFDASRMRKNTSTNLTTNLTISRDINLRWNTLSTTQLYNSTSNTNFNVTISVGATVTLVPNGPSTGNVCIDGLDGAGTGALLVEAGGTFTINGVLNISGKLYATTNNTSATYPCIWVINGTVYANEVVASNSGTGTHSLTINNGGKLNITGTPAWSTLGTTNNTYTFNTGSTVEYSATGNQLVRVASEFNAAMPATSKYYNLICSGSGTKSTNGALASPACELWVRNDLTINGSAVLSPSPNNNVIWLGGNWTSYGSAGYDEQAITVRFNGGAIVQNITCPGGEVYYMIDYRKTNASFYIKFNNDVDIIYQLFYTTNGYIDLNSHMLTIRNPSISGILGANFSKYIVSEKTDNSSKIKWKIGTGTTPVGNPYYTFPFGIPPGGTANYVPVLITKTAANDIGDVTISTYGTPPDNTPWPTTPTLVTNLQADIPIHNNPDNRHFTVDRFWEIDATNPLAVDTLKFSYRVTELPDSDPNPANLGAQFWNTPISYWNRTQYGAQTLLPTVYNVAVPSFDTYNTAWTLTSLISPLPIELLSFEARPEEKFVELKWLTASEINNAYFTVEKSIDGKMFFEIGTLPGAGNSNVKRNYSLNDENPTYGISYYRLKQTDYDGRFSYSDMVPVNYKKKISKYTLFPNPAADKAYILGVTGEPVDINISNIEGRLIKSFSIESGNSSFPIDLTELSKGIYYIEIKTTAESQYLKMIRN